MFALYSSPGGEFPETESSGLQELENINGESDGSAEGSQEESAAEPVVARKVGRPRKVVSDASKEERPKSGRGRGRPRKLFIEGSAAAMAAPAKRPRGRPRGRPPKKETASPVGEPSVKRPRGRPRKIPAGTDNKQ